MTMTAARSPIASAIVYDSITTDQRALATGVQVLQRTQCAIAVEMTPKRRVAAYCRVSTDRQQQATSLETQMKSFHEMIAAHADWELAGVYADEGLTGTSTKNRVQFQRMIADCEAGKIDYILTKAISRFARNTMDCLSYIRKLKDLGIYIYFDENRFDTGSSSSEMLITILAAVAQEESRSISENIKLGMRMRFKAGQPKWVNTYGFVKDEGGAYRIDTAQAKGVRRIFELYVSGDSLPTISRKLEQEHIPAMNGGKWWPKSLATVLHNEKYVGDVMMQKSYTVDHLSHRKVQNDQTVVPSYYVREHHAPIIDRKTFERVQIISALKDRHRGCVQYPYYGTLVCPLCGQKMVAFHLPACGHPSVWTCGGHRDADDSQTTCPPYAIHTKYIDRAVMEAYGNLNQGALEALAAQRSRQSDTARAALERLQASPYLQRVEYLFLDELVERITLDRWREVIIQWKFGLTSRIAVTYDKVSEIPDAELEHTGEGLRMDGERIRSGPQVLGRLHRIRASCAKARDSGERPKSLR